MSSSKVYVRWALAVSADFRAKMIQTPLDFVIVLYIKEILHRLGLRFIVIFKDSQNNHNSLFIISTMSQIKRPRRNIRHARESDSSSESGDDSTTVV